MSESAGPPGWWQDAAGNWHQSPPPAGGVSVDRSSGTARCPVCGAEWGDGVACARCGQVEGFPPGIRLTSAGRRLGGYLLDLVLSFVTLGIGWLIWALIIFGRGQTPGKQLLGTRVAKLPTHTRAGWGLTFLREFVIKGIAFGLLVTFTLGLGAILYFWLLWDRNNQQLWDKILDTVVVDDPQKTL